MINLPLIIFIGLATLGGAVVLIFLIFAILEKLGYFKDDRRGDKI